VRVVILEDYLNSRTRRAGFDVIPKNQDRKSSLAFLAECRDVAAYGGYTEEDYDWKFIPAAGNIIALIEGLPQNLAADKDIERQNQRHATYLT
jgi:hypothetical protein